MTTRLLSRPGSEVGILDEVRTAILGCDQDRLSELMVALGAAGQDEGAANYALGLLAEAPHDVRVYWFGECNCDGHQN